MFIHLGPNMHDLNTIVVPKVSAEWTDIAYALKYEIPTVRQIKSKHNENPTKCCKELFEDWLATSNGITPKTWGTLLDKFKEISDLDAVTKEITEQLLQKGFTTLYVPTHVAR